MGKLASIILGTISVLAISYYILSPAFSPVTNWFGTLIGYKLTMLLGLMYLFAGNPLHHPVLIPAWALVALVVALSSRKILRAILSAMLVYSLSLLFAVMAVISLLFQFIPTTLPGAGSSPISSSSAGFPSMSMLPPVPPGSDIISILNEPVIGTFINSVLSALSSPVKQSAGTAGPSSLIGQLSFLDPLILHIAENAIIFVVLAGLFAYLLREVVRRLGTRELKTGTAQKAVSCFIIASLVISVLLAHSTVGSAYPSSGGPLNPGSMQGANSSFGLRTRATESTAYMPYLNTLSSLLSRYSGQDIFPQLRPGSDTPYTAVSDGVTPDRFNSSASSMSTNFTWSGGSYVEMNAAFASKSGNSNDIYLFARGTGQSAGTNGTQWYSSGAVSHSMFTAVIESAGLPNFFLEGGLPSISAGGFNPGFAYSNAIPPLLIVEAFQGSTGATGIEAGYEVALLAHTMHISQPMLALRLARSVSINGSATNVSIYIYGGDYNFARLAAGYLNGMVSGFQSSGLIVPYMEMIRSGYFIPSATRDSVNGSVMVAAYASPRGLALLPAQASSLFGNATRSAGIALIAGIGIRNSVLNFSQTGNITLTRLTDYSRTIYFDSSANLSVLAIGAPSGNASTSTGATFSGTGFKIYTSNTSYGSLFGVAPQNNSSVSLVSGAGIDPGNVSVHASSAFPADLRVRTSVMNNGGRENVKTVVYNGGVDAISNIAVNESSLLEYYGNQIAVISGKPDGFYQTLSPGQSVTLSYTIELNGVGLYLLPPLVSVSYQLMQNSFNMSYSSSKFFRSGNPDVFYASNSVIESFLHGVSRFVSVLRPLAQPIVGDFYVFDTIIILFFILAFYIEYRAFMKWKHLRESNRQSLE